MERGKTLDDGKHDEAGVVAVVRPRNVRSLQYPCINENDDDDDGVDSGDVGNVAEVTVTGDAPVVVLKLRASRRKLMNKIHFSVCTINN